MVRVGLGCAILPSLAVTGAVGDPALRIHPLDPSPSREIHLHWPARRPMSAVAARALELARQIADDLVPRG